MVKNRSYISTFAALILVGATSIGLSGCASLDEAFGFAKNAPDESQVITHEPLVTPNVATLPQPGEGIDNTIVPEPKDKSEEVKRQLAEEKKRKIIHEGATPETLAQVQEKTGNEELSAPQPRTTPGQDSQASEDKPWWKIW